MRKLILSMALLSMSVLNALNLMSENYPPYNYSDKNEQPTGISIDIVREIIKKTGDKDNITILPWARSYHNIQIKKNQVLFVMTRTEQRENLFKWVGPIASYNWVIFSNKNFKGTINSLNDLKNNKYTIGTYKDDACELFLKEQKFKNFSSVSDDDLNVKKLARNRIDFWITGEYQGLIRAKKFGQSNNIKKILNVKNMELYIAFSKDIDDSIINRWQKELDILKANGKYQKIIDNYLK